MDAVAHMPMGWQKTLMDAIYDHRPVFTFGEWFTGEDGNDNYHRFINDSGMNLLDFRFAQTARRVLMEGQGTMYDLEAMLRHTANDYERPQDQVTFIDNHDMNRFTKDGLPERMTDIGLAFLLTSRGVPTIYYGTEHYMTGEGDPENRKMMGSFDRSSPAFRIISKLSNLRKENRALSYGETKERWLNDDVFIYERQFGHDKILVAMNRSLTNQVQISNLQTNMSPGQYEDALSGLLDGQALSITENGTAPTFSLSPGEVSVWSETTDTAAAPVIGTVSQPMGQNGQTISLYGNGFGPGQGTVTIGESVATVESWNDESIEVTIPEMDGGHYSIEVNRADGEEAAYSNFEVLSGKLIPVRIVVNQLETSFGENAYVVGNVHELGQWQVDKAIGPMFNQVLYQYPTWYYDVHVPINSELEFKFLIKDAEGNVRWEQGQNHLYETSNGGTDTIIVNFQG